jgi:uncharacterized protein involved in outer membrane biogenesis
VALGLGGLVALSFALALVLVDGDRVREAIGARLEAMLGEPVELGAAELSLFPLPTARIRDARIGARLEAHEIRVGVSLPALLVGRVVLRSLEIQSPQLRLSTPPDPAPARSGSRWNSARAGDVDLAITSLAVREGTLDVGAERLEQLELSGGLDLTLGAGFDFSAYAPGIGRFEDGRLEIDGLSGAPTQWTWTANARVAGVDLEQLRDRIGSRALWGKAEGDIRIAGTGTSVQTGSLELESEDFEVRGDLLRVWGPTRLRGEYPERRLELDLTQARVSVAQQAEKSPGVALRLEASGIELDETGPRVGELRIASDALRASGELEIRAGNPELELDGGSLDLARFATDWTGPSWLPRSGRVDLERLRFDASTLALRAKGSLARVGVQLPSGLELMLDGPVFADGTTVGADGLRVEIAGETISTSLRYDATSRQIQLALLAEGTRVAPVLEKLMNFKDVSGRLYARLELSGPLDLYALKGKGELDLVDGAWIGLDLPRLALPVLPDPDTRTAPPQRIRLRIEVDGEEVNVVEGSIEQDYARATLSGVFYLRDRVVDLSGELSVFSPDLPEPVVLPILKAGGPLNAMAISVGGADSPEVRAAAAAMVDAIRKAERERRRTEHEQRKAEVPES